MTDLMQALSEPYGVHRHVMALLCILAFAGLTWRFVGRLDAARTLTAVLTALFAVLELFVALGAARRAALGGPWNEAGWAIMGHAVAVLVLVAAWDRLPLHTPTERHTS